ncbi:MAG: serine/threonine protein kinase [Rivularia sp. (in: Bacteria)]|nr:serine/threonine protein kinase [Rivularia sp. MS3]
MKLLHQVGDILNQKYHIIEILGQGGIGITYLAKDLETNINLALKILSLRRMTDWKKIELFKRESQILSQLNHPAIPQYIDYFQIETDNDNSFYIAQQLAPGKSLVELIENGWHPDESEVKGIAIQILDILTYLHSFSPPIIHRDIKPQNIIRGDDGKVFLVDFGAVADTYHNTVTGGSTVVGTFGYMAPEQFRGKAFPSTDLYGLGTTLLYLLTKKHPADLPQKFLKIDFRSQIKVKLSSNFAQWLDTIIEPVAESRFPDAEIALTVLQDKESLDKYFIYKPRKPKDTTISLRRSDEELQIDIPAGKFRNNYRLVLAILVLFGNGLLLLIFLAIFQYSNFPDILFGIFFIFFLSPSFLFFWFISLIYFVLNPLSRIKLTIFKKDNYNLFICQKWLWFLLHDNLQGKVHEKLFKKTLKSIKYNLTPQEYRWLKAEINNFMK